MSALIRVGQAALRRGLALSSSSGRARLGRCITTSPKKNETKAEDENPYLTKTPWVCHGFDHKSQYMDRYLLHFTLFLSITIGIVCGAYVFAYTPDTKLVNWAKREAYLQLRHREEHGLPLIDINYIDPAKLVLPSEEELVNVEVIV